MFVFYFLILAMLISTALYFKFIVAHQEKTFEADDKMSETIANFRARAQKSGYNISADHGLGWYITYCLIKNF